MIGNLKSPHNLWLVLQTAHGTKTWAKNVLRHDVSHCTYQQCCRISSLHFLLLPLGLPLFFILLRSLQFSLLLYTWKNPTCIWINAATSNQVQTFPLTSGGRLEVELDISQSPLQFPLFQVAWSPRNVVAGSSAETSHCNTWAQRDFVYTWTHISKTQNS